MGVLEKLPTFATMCVLVMIFACLKRHTRSARLTLWAVGWTLVFIHFLAQLVESGQSGAFLHAIDAGALQAAGVAFLVSVSSVAEDRMRRTLLLFVLGASSITYAVLVSCDVHARWPYMLCLGVCFGGGAAFFLRVHRRVSLYLGAILALCAALAAWAIHGAASGAFYEGTTALLGCGFALSGIFNYRNSRGPSPAVLTISGGFLCWGAAFPVLALVDHVAPHMMVPRALWDVPKLFVAFGMILTVVEDKSRAIAGMRCQAERLNRQLERFSGITSRLLSGAALDEICPDIASAITEVSGFPTALIHIEDADGKFRVAGGSGPLQASLMKVLGPKQDWTSESIRSLCSHDQRIGKRSFCLSRARAHSEDHFGLEVGNYVALLIPLWSPAGACLGSILLRAPGDGGIPEDELAHIESLAADLAVAVEMKVLHTQLVWSEKLAALGQLVAGVAHELNNPLTAIMGYGELLGDAITSTRTRDQLTRLMSETRRMKRITDNLLRFSRRSSRDTNAACFSPVVQEVLALCEYYTRKSNVQVEVEVAPNLPSLAINEDEMKQILLNLFNNSCDALCGFPGSKQITIRAYQAGAQAVIQVEDTGPGFSNLNRALDPFYTTKPVGKGTGLGLSVCYGIARKRGGDLRIENVQPHGGRVTLQVPLADSRKDPLLVTSAHA